jgi:hypothetical protein
VAVPPGSKSRLVVDVGHDPRGDWQLVVKVNGKTRLKQLVGPKTTQEGWTTATVDLSEFAGQTVAVELHNEANNWSYEFGYWGRIAVVPE